VRLHTTIISTSTRTGTCTSSTSSSSTGKSTKGDVEPLAPKVVGFVPKMENEIWPWERRQCIVQGRSGTMLKEMEFRIELEH
jgi:hypothetical protein